MNEASIRDLLINQLDCIEHGLKYLEKEKYIPSDIGTDSFIDIVARDLNDNWVIIELKRSKSTSRQAIHEVLKYVEAVKAHLGVRDDEIRVAVVSTIWDELLVPFSKLYTETTLDITGFKIDVSNPALLTCQKVKPVEITSGRVLSPWHELNMYTDKTSLLRGVNSYVHANNSKGIDNYVLVILEAPAGHHERVLEATREGLAKVQRRYTNEVDYNAINSQLEKLEEYKFILYFVPQLLAREACIEALRRSDEDLEELKEILEDMDEDEALCTLHENLFAANPRTFNEHYEIGYPAKFKSRLIDDEGWKIVEMKRYGSLARNQLLTDQTIISEICGETGSSGQTFKRIISMASKSQVSIARSEIAECLSDNPIWRSHILSHLDEIQNDFPSSNVEISIFNPSTGLFSLFFAVTMERGELYIPSYSLVVRNKDEIVLLFFGDLAAGENQATFREVIDRFYDGDIGMLLMSAIWGYRAYQDVELLNFIGIKYGSFRCNIDGNERRFFVWRDSAWRETEPIFPYQSLFNFIERETVFMNHLVTKVGRRMNGGVVDGSNADKPLIDLAGESPPNGPLYADTSFASHCDLCECAFAEENFLVDAAVPSHGGSWAYLCADCVAETGAIIGWGQGQLYQRLESGAWQRVAGGPPDADMD
ncbi:MAG: endonuclease NucS [Rhodospirillaceae bacterium]|nr:endonuclease NucS [Rhodospirillaceae bacterium]